jgi:hypothetical protein
MTPTVLKVILRALFLLLGYTAKTAGAAFPGFGNFSDGPVGPHVPATRFGFGLYQRTLSMEQSGR